MIKSLALIFLVGLALGALFTRLNLPKIIGMLIAGVILGPHGLDLLDPSILGISGDLRQMALIIILIKAGLALNLKELRKVGRPALLLTFLPASFEILAYFLIAPRLFGLPPVEAAVMGAVLGAVSPAVVVPRMVTLIEEQWGTKKAIPQMILAAASLDDIFVIVLFTTFLGMTQGSAVHLAAFLNVPVAIGLGLLVGFILSLGLHALFEAAQRRGSSIDNSLKVLIVLACAMLLVSLEEGLKGIVPLSGLIAVMGMANGLGTKSTPEVARSLSDKFGQLWLGAEVLLFVLVGAAVDVRYTFEAGPKALLLLGLALAFRTLAVVLSTLGTELNFKERLFTAFAYLPKATVQAAIGGVPLAMGLPSGQLILSVAVLGIVVTAPLGAILMDRSYQKLLEKDDA